MKPCGGEINGAWDSKSGNVKLGELPEMPSPGLDYRRARPVLSVPVLGETA
jgi:hypothetical protein